MDIRSNKHAQWQIHPGFWGGQRAEGRPYSQRSPPGPHEWLLIDQACALLDAFRLRGDARERSPGTHTANAEIDPVWDFNAFVAKIPGHTRFTQITLRLALLDGGYQTSTCSGTSVDVPSTMRILAVLVSNVTRTSARAVPDYG